ncbi:MAG: alpha/beta hydrolase [Gammaproteobacteria bacterium]
MEGESERGDALRRHNVHVIGRAEAPATLVFVHGFGTDQRAWEAIVPTFADDYRIVLLDNAGAGGADPAAFQQSRYLNLHGYASDLLEVCAALDVHDAILVGHSVGAMIGVLAALAEPQRFARLVLIGASPRYLDDGAYRGGFSEDDLNGLYTAIDADYEGWADAFAPLAMGNPSQPALAEHFAAALKAVPQDHAYTTLCAIFQSDHRAEVARLTQPVLIVQSRDDVAVPQAVAEYLAAHIPDSRLVTIDASGHLPHLSAPGAVVAAIRPFL